MAHFFSDFRELTRYAVAMGRKPTRPLTQFGQYLEAIKGSMSEGQIERWYKENPEAKIVKIDDAAIANDSRDPKRNVSPDRMLAYATIFRVQLEDIVREWVKYKYGVEIRPGAKRLEDLYPDPKIAKLHRALDVLIHKGGRLQMPYDLDVEHFLGRILAEHGPWLAKSGGKRGKQRGKTAKD